MPFIEKQQITTPVQLKVRIEPDVHADLLQYFQFLKSKPDYVVTEVLRKVMRQDRDFQKHLAENGKSRPAAEAAKA